MFVRNFTKRSAAVHELYMSYRVDDVLTMLNTILPSLPRAVTTFTCVKFKTVVMEPVVIESTFQ